MNFLEIFAADCSTIRKDGASQGRGEQNAKNEWKLSSDLDISSKMS